MRSAHNYAGAVLHLAGLCLHPLPLPGAWAVPASIQ